nr:MAG TPA: hypothetical protein [Caudoviricetes sp.]
MFPSGLFCYFLKLDLIILRFNRNVKCFLRFFRIFLFYSLLFCVFAVKYTI